MRGKKVLPRASAALESSLKSGAPDVLLVPFIDCHKHQDGLTFQDSDLSQTLRVMAWPNRSQFACH